MIYRSLIQVDICGGVYFCCLGFAYRIVLNLAWSSETGTGAAGEQPRYSVAGSARDNLLLKVNTSK
jgi:hypothetical protein